MFAWNSEKAKANIKKHGVSFENACGVFFDSNSLRLNAKVIAGEKRTIRIGRGFDSRVLVVVFTVRQTQYDEEKIRIISARQASSKERKAYQRL